MTVFGVVRMSWLDLEMSRLGKRTSGCICEDESRDDWNTGQCEGLRPRPECGRHQSVGWGAGQKDRGSWGALPAHTCSVLPGCFKLLLADAMPPQLTGTYKVITPKKDFFPQNCLSWLFCLSNKRLRNSMVKLSTSTALNFYLRKVKTADVVHIFICLKAQSFPNCALWYVSTAFLLTHCAVFQLW